MTEPSGGCCQRFCGQILSLAVSGVFLWLYIRNSNPKIYINHFYLPALDNSSNSNTTLYFNLKLANPNLVKGIYYDALNLTFFYQPPNTSIIVGDKVIFGFYQGHSKNAIKTDSVELRGVNWEVVPNNTAVVFKVDLASKVRFKYVFWNSKRRKINVGANVEINNQGTKVNKKDIRLKSVAPPEQGRYGAPAVVVVFTFYILNCL